MRDPFISTTVVSGEGDIGTLVWNNNGTPPTGTLVKKYRWARQGPLIFLSWNIEYTGGSTASQSFVYFILPSDVPRPKLPSTTSVAKGTGNGGLLNGTGSLNGTGTATLYNSGTEYRVYTSNPSATNAMGAVGTLTYIADNVE